VILVRAQLLDACRVDVETQGIERAPETHRQRQSDIAQSNDGKANLVGAGQGGCRHGGFPEGEKRKFSKRR
jgi:hypothetical protein